MNMNTPSDELVTYIRNGLAAGQTPETIRAALKTAGWPDAEVAAAFAPPAVPGAKGKKNFPLKLTIGAVVVALVGLGLAAYFVFLKNPDRGPAGNNNLPSGPAVNTAIVNSSAAPPGNVNSPAGSGDDATVNDGDMTLAVLNIPAAQNAYLDPTTLAAVTTDSAVNPAGNALDQLSGAKAWDQTYVDDLVKKNQAAISAFSQAVPKFAFQVPAFSDPRSIDAAAHVDYGSLQTLSEVIALDAISHVKNKDAANGAAEALAVAVYGQKMATSQIDSVGYAVGIGIKDIGLTAFKKITTLAPPTAADAGQADGLLAAFDDTSGALADAFKIDYWVDRAALAATIKDPSGFSPDITPADFTDAFLLEQKKTINLIAAAARDKIRMTKDACRIFSDPPPEAAAIASLHELKIENAIGQLIAVSDQAGGAAPNNLRCADAALVASVRAALAAIIKAK